MRENIRTKINGALERCYASATLTSGQFPVFVVEEPANAEHGDFATNVAMVLGKAERKAPRVVAEALAAELRADGFCARVDIAGPGFINFFLKNEAWQQTLLTIYRAGAEYGKSSIGAGRKVQV